jgi:hypothetical protein
MPAIGRQVGRRGGAAKRHPSLVAGRARCAFRAQTLHKRHRGCAGNGGRAIPPAHARQSTLPPELRRDGKAVWPGRRGPQKASASALAKDRIKRVERSDQRAVICPGPAACDLPGQPNKLLITLGNPLGNGVTVAQQTLTLFVLVRIQVPQPPVLRPSPSEFPVSLRAQVRLSAT